MKRRLLTMLIFLLAGAVVNVAVAWGCATWSPLRLSSSLVDKPTEVEQNWWRTVASPECAPSATAVWRSNGFGCSSLLALGDRSGEALFRRDKTGQATFNASVTATMDRVTTIRAGWPYESYSGERWDVGITLMTPIPMLGHQVTTWREADLQSFAMTFDRPARLGGSSFRMLPLRPLWPGFLLNTLFYATLLWLLIRGLFALRRLLRVRRGQCPKCAYPMGESVVCTECGKPVPKARLQCQ